MNTKRTAVIGGTAALLLLLTGCAGVDGQFDDSARGDAAANRAESKAQTGLTVEQAEQAREAFDQLRDSTEARFQAERTERNAATMAVNEQIRAGKQAESTPATSVQELIRQSKQAESRPLTSYAQAEVQESIREAKQAESEPAPETQEPMTPEKVREHKASQVQ